MAFKMRSGNKPTFKDMGSSPNDMYMENSPSNMMGQGDPSSPNKILPILGAGLVHGARMLGTWALRKGGQKLLQKGGKQLLKKGGKQLFSKGSKNLIKAPKNLLPVKYVHKKMGVSKPTKMPNFTRPKTGAPKGKLPKDIDKLTPQKTFMQKIKPYMPGWKTVVGTGAVMGLSQAMLPKDKSQGMAPPPPPRGTSGGTTIKSKPTKTKPIKTTPVSTQKPKKIKDTLTTTKKRPIGGAKKVSTTTYPGGGVKQTTKIKGRAFGEGKKIKQRNYDEAGNLTSKTKEKYRRKGGGGEGMAQDYYKGKMKKKKTVTKTGGTVTKTKIKYNKDGTIKRQKTRTRKRRLTWL